MHRLQVGGDRLAPVLIRFALASVCGAWLYARAKLPQLSEIKVAPQLLYAENLTTNNRDLYWAARTWAKENNFKFVWVRNGRNYLRQKEGGVAIGSAHSTDFSKLV